MQGRRILVTRAAHQADDLSRRLRVLGAEPVEFPVIAIVPPDDWSPLDAALARLADYDWLVFTSATGVQIFWNRFEAHIGRGAPHLQIPRLAAIGPATAAALRARGLEPQVVPETYVAEALAQALGDVRGQRILLARADIARKALPVLLRAAGATVDEVVLYRTVPVQSDLALADILAHGPLGAITFTSSSTVRQFIERVGPEGLAALRDVPVACIGPVTAATARELDLRVDAVAQEYTMDGLVAALLTLWPPPPEHLPAPERKGEVS